MIQVSLVLVRVPVAAGLEQHNMKRGGVYINPARIDTVTPMETPDDRARDHVPEDVRAVIRYDDNRTGFRLLYVSNTPYEIARARRREILGEDSDLPDFGSLSGA